MHAVFEPDNDLSFFRGRLDVKRCDLCKQLLDKWGEDLSVVSIPGRMRFALSASYDGVVIAAETFRKMYLSAGMSGLSFSAVGARHFHVQATKVVEFDAERRGTRFLKRCEKCGQHESVVGVTPVFLRSGAVVADLGFARTDLEFGSGDEKSPVLICGDGAAALLRANVPEVDLESARE